MQCPICKQTVPDYYHSSHALYCCFDCFIQIWETKLKHKAKCDGQLICWDLARLRLQAMGYGAAEVDKGIRDLKRKLRGRHGKKRK